MRILSPAPGQNHGGRLADVAQHRILNRHRAAVVHDLRMLKGSVGGTEDLGADIGVRIEHLLPMREGPVADLVEPDFPELLAQFGGGQRGESRQLGIRQVFEQVQFGQPGLD